MISTITSLVHHLLWRSLVGTLVVSFACTANRSAGNPDAAAVACVNARCLPGNLCVDGQCRLLCTRHDDCPENLGYRCATGLADDGGGQKLVCRPGAVAKSPGGYGTPCGLHLDADCDAAGGFTCPGNQNDVDATCTKLGGCADDADCPSAMYCGTLTQSACVSLTACAGDADCQRFTGSTCTDFAAGTRYCADQQSCHTNPDDCPLGASCRPLPGNGTKFKLVRACIASGSCAPCQTDLDCFEPGAACVPDQQGAGFCSRACDIGGTSCDPAADCKPGPKGNRCFPKAGSCHGDASPCATCRDDGDCGPEGTCRLIETTRERFCVQPCQGTTCPRAPGGGSMTCCTGANCGSALNACLPEGHTNPYPRWSTGCWLRPCQVNADCGPTELCDVRSLSFVGPNDQLTQCGTAGVCRAPHDPTDAVDYVVHKRVCDCAGNQYLTEAALAEVRGAAFRGCCATVTSAAGNTYSCPVP